MRRPNLTKKTIEGISTVLWLVEEDVRGDERWPPDHPVHNAITYLLHLRAWHKRTDPQGATR